jgi:hypothetical protein
LNWKFGGFFALENATGIDAGDMEIFAIFAFQRQVVLSVVPNFSGTFSVMSTVKTPNFESALRRNTARWRPIVI